MDYVGRIVKAFSQSVSCPDIVIWKGCHIITCLHSLPSWSAAAIQSYILRPPEYIHTLCMHTIQICKGAAYNTYCTGTVGKGTEPPLEIACLYIFSQCTRDSK